MASLQSYKERLKKKKIVDLIDEKGTTVGYPRHYIGLSGLGGGCLRALWFNFRWFAEGTIVGRTNRIFSVGHEFENLIIRDLESIGIKCSHTIKDQLEFVDTYGYAKGHPDGVGIGIPDDEEEEYLLEFKTANDKSFKDMVKKHLKVSKPTYYAQMILYMYKGNLDKGLFVMINKNDSSYHIEKVKSDTNFAKELLRKAESIVFSEDFNDFPRIGNNTPEWYECGWCNYNGICFGKRKTKLKNCRTCKNMDLINNGKFACSLTEEELDLDNQIKGCEKHEFLECAK